MSGRKSGQKRCVSPGAPLPSPRQHYPNASSSWRTSPSGAGRRRAVPPAVFAALFGVSVPPFVHAPGLIHSAAGGTTFVVSPKLIVTMEMGLLLVADLPLSLDKVSTLLFHCAIDGEESRFPEAEAVVQTPRMHEHLPTSDEE